MRTYLVTGGAGFIGSNYIHYMFGKYGDSIRIINIDKLTYAGNLENLRSVEGRSNYTFIKADICDAHAVGRIFEENDIDRVVHFAAESHVDRSIRDPEVFANITNCSNNYGPYQFPEKLIPLIINNALQGRSLPVYGDGRNVRDWLYVEDHAKAIDMVQEKGRLFETYNIGGHNERENIQIVKTILKTLQEMLDEKDPRRKKVSEDLITYVEDRKGHDRRYAIAPDKIKSEVGWEPDTKFEDGIRLTIQWFFENEEWMANVTSGDYTKYYEEMYHDKQEVSRS